MIFLYFIKITIAVGVDLKLSNKFKLPFLGKLLDIEKLFQLNFEVIFSIKVHAPAKMLLFYLNFPACHKTSLQI
jgi:hypothetical protein